MPALPLFVLQAVGATFVLMGAIAVLAVNAYVALHRYLAPRVDFALVRFDAWLAARRRYSYSQPIPYALPYTHVGYPVLAGLFVGAPETEDVAYTVLMDRGDTVTVEQEAPTVAIRSFLPVSPASPVCTAEADSARMESEGCMIYAPVPASPSVASLTSAEPSNAVQVKRTAKGRQKGKESVQTTAANPPVKGGKVHISDGSKPICGASGHASRRMVVGHSTIPHAATCERCIKLFGKRKNS